MMVCSVLKVLSVVHEALRASVESVMFAHQALKSLVLEIHAKIALLVGTTQVSFKHVCNACKAPHQMRLVANVVEQHFAFRVLSTTRQSFVWVGPAPMQLIRCTQTRGGRLATWDRRGVIQDHKSTALGPAAKRAIAYQRIQAIITAILASGACLALRENNRAPTDQLVTIVKLALSVLQVCVPRATQVKLPVLDSHDVSTVLLGWNQMILERTVSLALME
jgi:hypothetical protein